MNDEEDEEEEEEGDDSLFLTDPFYQSRPKLAKTIAKHELVFVSIKDSVEKDKAGVIN